MYEKKYDPNEVRWIGEGGEHVTAGKEDWEKMLRQWEQEGLDTEVVQFAKPMLMGTGQQQSIASKYLTKVRDDYMEPTDAMAGLARLSKKYADGRVGHVPQVLESDFNDAWDDYSGSGRNANTAGNWSFGRSDASDRQTLRGGSDSD